MTTTQDQWRNWLASFVNHTLEIREALNTILTNMYEADDHHDEEGEPYRDYEMGCRAIERFDQMLLSAPSHIQKGEPMSENVTYEQVIERACQLIDSINKIKALEQRLAALRQDLSRVNTIRCQEDFDRHADLHQQVQVGVRQYDDANEAFSRARAALSEMLKTRMSPEADLIVKHEGFSYRVSLERQNGDMVATIFRIRPVLAEASF